MRTLFSLTIAVGLLYALTPALLHAQTPIAESISPNPNDVQYQSKGDQHRTYSFPETGESIPYRLYVPSRWNRDARLPLMVILHSGNSIDVPFQRGNGVLAKVAEERGYIVLSPEGYRPRPRWNSPFGAVSADGTVSEYERDPRSEQDLLNVSELVAQEYNVDRSHIYLFSNSHGGAGVWYLGQQHPDVWAAIAVSSAPIRPDGYPFDRLKTVPVLVIHGTHDDSMSYDAAFRIAAVAKENGVDATFMPVMNGTHLEAWTMVFPRMLDFFDQHQKE